MKTYVILADGDFPKHPAAVELLRSASGIVCCDGAAEKLIENGFVPDAIVGDMDSLSTDFQNQYRNIIHRDPDQETNDLTKAFDYTLTLSPDKIYILGATGLREDHTLGNISLLTSYSEKTGVPVEMCTDYGKFLSIEGDVEISMKKGDQISLFALDPQTRIISEGLKFPLKEVIFDSWWKGTLNEASSDTVRLRINMGKVIVFQPY
ncbi:Thiamine Pyrophosphokinase [Bacteroidales bacterium CF]|jgi:thiamine pyrophosphokinase|nr:Thiamine Pyrophosphokinase [Bacteroidales bacterium CF]NCB97992.1 thiamine diphosphokinase [Bacteroidia bacterium]